MKINIPKEWINRRAALEEGCEIGAGSLKGMVRPMKAPKINLSELSPVFGWQEQNEIVYLRCPKGHISRLDHGIDEKGIVSPSVQCPKCDFHESDLELEGYSA